MRPTVRTHWRLGLLPPMTVARDRRIEPNAPCLEHVSPGHAERRASRQQSMTATRRSGRVGAPGGQPALGCQGGWAANLDLGLIRRPSVEGLWLAEPGDRLTVRPALVAGRRCGEVSLCGFVTCRRGGCSSCSCCSRRWSRSVLRMPSSRGDVVLIAERTSQTADGRARPGGEPAGGASPLRCLLVASPAVVVLAAVAATALLTVAAPWWSFLLLAAAICAALVCVIRD